LLFLGSPAYDQRSLCAAGSTTDARRGGGDEDASSFRSNVTDVRTVDALPLFGMNLTLTRTVIRPFRVNWRFARSANFTPIRWVPAFDTDLMA
jgi:hypothetical protein